jgi:[protein-PII] uridylyltransferase
LDYLYLLTVADIAGTSQKLWNSWKDKLLADLYASARFMLREGLERPPHAAERVRETQASARELLLEQGYSADMIAHIWTDFPVETFLRFRPEHIAWQTAGIAMAGATLRAPLVLIDNVGPRGGSEIFVYAPDGDGLFAAVTAVLERMRLSIIDARIVTSVSGMGMDSFLALDQASRPLDTETAQRLYGALTEVLSQTPYSTQIAEQRPARRLRHFQVATRIEYRDDAASGRTQLALVCSDRPGLLAAIAQTFRARAVRVHDARIATFGERVEDFFLITDDENRPLGTPEREYLRMALLAAIALPPASNSTLVRTYDIA